MIDDAHVLCTMGSGPGQNPMGGSMKIGNGRGCLKPGNTDGVRMHDIMKNSMKYRNLLFLTSKPAMETLEDM